MVNSFFISINEMMSTFNDINVFSVLTTRSRMFGHHPHLQSPKIKRQLPLMPNRQQEQAPHAGETFQVRADSVRQLIQQGIESLRRFGLQRKGFNLSQVALEVGREFDGVPGRHGVNRTINPLPWPYGDA